MGTKRKEARGHGVKGSGQLKAQGGSSHLHGPGGRKPPSAKRSRPAGRLGWGRGEEGRTGSQVEAWSSSLFPACTPWVVVAVTLAIRVYYVTQPRNWWVLHPDETFQSLEVAYSELHGYGFRPYEYLPPPDLLRSRLTHVRQRELELGMFAMRSPLHPFFYVLVSKVARLLGSSTKDYVLWKAAHAAVAALLPGATYKFSRVISPSHDTASVAAILAATSVQLAVLGTHTLVNSLLAPLVLLALATLLQAARGAGGRGRGTPGHGRPDLQGKGHAEVKGKELRSHRNDRQREMFGKDALGVRDTSKAGRRANFGQESLGEYQLRPNGYGSDDVFKKIETKIPNGACNGAANGRTLLAGSVPNSANGETKREALSEGPDAEWKGSGQHCPASLCPSHSGGVTRGGSVLGEEGVLLPTTVAQAGSRPPPGVDCQGDRHGACSKGKSQFGNGLRGQDKQPSDVATSVSSLTICDKDVRANGSAVVVGSATRPEMSRRSSAGRADLVEEGRGEDSPSTAALCLASFALCLCCYVRVDLCLLALLVVAPHLASPGALRRLLPPGMAGALLALAVGVSCDVAFYGTFLVSPYNWMKFNAFSRMSATFFGAMESDFYLREIFLRNTGLLSLSCCSLGVFLVAVYRLCSGRLQEEEGRKVVDAGKLLLSFLLLLGLYSAKEHKEVRFLHNALVLLFVFVAIVLTEVVGALTEARKVLRYSLVLVLVVFACSQWKAFPHPSDKSNLPWAYAQAVDSGDVNACLDFISRQPDVTGVFVDKYIHSTGGYSVLGKKVPIIAVIIFEFFEFSSESRVLVKSNRWLVDGTQSQLELYTFDCPSDFISKLNAPYLLKVLLAKTEYNYLVMESKRGFIETGYTEMFRVGGLRVLRRNFDPTQEEKLRQIESTIPLGSNATVLEHEAHWLFQYKLYDLSVAKLNRVLSLDLHRPNAYKLLASCYSQLGKDAEALHVLRMCRKANGSQKCNEKYSRVDLHPGYRTITP